MNGKTSKGKKGKAEKEEKIEKVQENHKSEMEIEKKESAMEEEEEEDDYVVRKKENLEAKKSVEANGEDKIEEETKGENEIEEEKQKAKEEAEAEKRRIEEEEKEREHALELERQKELEREQEKELQRQRDRQQRREERERRRKKREQDELYGMNFDYWFEKVIEYQTPLQEEQDTLDKDIVQPGQKSTPLAVGQSHPLFVFRKRKPSELNMESIKNVILTTESGLTTYLEKWEARWAHPTIRQEIVINLPLSRSCKKL